MALDVATLWAAFHAFGAAPPLGVLVLAYTLGQLGGLIPLPGASAAPTVLSSAPSSSSAPR